MSDLEVRHSDTVHDDGVDEKAFAIHALIGVLVGLPVFIVALYGLLTAFTDQEARTVAAISGWSSIWAALFLGGGMGAGIWLLRNEH